MPKLQLSWVRSQHPPTQWNLRTRQMNQCCAEKTKNLYCLHSLPVYPTCGSLPDRLDERLAALVLRSQLQGLPQLPGNTAPVLWQLFGNFHDFPFVAEHYTQDTETRKPPSNWSEVNKHECFADLGNLMLPCSSSVII
jgi:hypothetical protein